jgi:hypothetical protein
MMKGKGIALTAVLASMLVVGSASAAYDSIQHNLFTNFNGNTSFNPGTGEFLVTETTSNLLTLNDPLPLTGVVTNAQTTISTFFQGIVPGPAALFTGGSISLTFDYDPDGAGPDPVGSYGISGPITGMFFEVTAGPNSSIDGLGRWTATTVNLPGSGIWPDGGGFSSIDSLSVAFAQDLTGFDWASELQGDIRTLYSLFPDDRAIPEPATAALVAFGALALIRRRK